MPYKNFKLYLGYKDVPNTSYTQTDITGNWSVSTFNNRSTASYSIALPPGSDYTLVSSNCSSSYTGTISALLMSFSNSIMFQTSKSGIFTAQQLEAINASVMSYTISYTARVGEKYIRSYLGSKQGTKTENLSAIIPTWKKVREVTGYRYTGIFNLPKVYSEAIAVNSFTISAVSTATDKTCTIAEHGSQLIFTFLYPTSTSFSNISVSANISYIATIGEPLIIKSDTAMEVDYDDLANNYIDTLSNLSITVSGDNLNVTFTPVTDSVLLNAVDNEDTYIRLQLLVHQPSAYMHKTSIRIPMSYNKPLWIDESDYSTLSEHGQGFSYVRRRSHESRFYGKSWLNLTKAQLQAGSATLSDLSYAICDDGEGNRVENDTTNAQAYNIRVEMFCAALYRKGKDVFYYERSGHKRISDNRTYILM